MIIVIFDDKDFIAAKIKYFRKKHFFTQEKLAETIGISAKQLSRIENGDYIPSLPTFLKIVKTLDIDMSEFGLNLTKNVNPHREKLLKFIYKLTDDETNFYYNIVTNLSDNIKFVIK